MTQKRKTKRDMAMSQTMKVIRNAHAGMPQTQVLSMASKQISDKNKTGGFGAGKFSQKISYFPENF